MNFTSKPRWILIIGFLGASGVALGAIAAHVLEEPAATSVERASTYQVLHAITLLVLCAASGRLVTIARWTMLAGIVGFSGAIYAKYLLHLPALGALAPIGGSLLILSWLLLAVSWIGQNSTRSD